MGMSRIENHQKLEMLNIVKLVAAYMVVFIHVSFSGKFGVAIICLARFAVPLFFMISGYFSYTSIKSGNTIKLDNKIYSIGRLYLESISFYVILVMCVLRNIDKFKAWLNVGINAKAIVKWILFNKFSMIELEHLWFIGALLYCYIFMRSFYKHENIIKFLPLLLIVNYILGEGNAVLHLTEVPEYATRNAWFCGLPCFAIGYLIREQKNSHKVELLLKSGINKVFLVAALVSEGMVLIEAHFVGLTDLYVFSLLTAVFLLLYGITYKGQINDKLKVITEINTGMIYIGHQGIAIIIRSAMEKIHFDNGKVTLPILTCLIVTMVAMVHNKIRKSLKTD